MIVVTQLNVQEAAGIKRARNHEADINANVIIASREGEKEARKKRRRNREDECNEKRTFYSFLEVRGG